MTDDQRPTTNDRLYERRPHGPTKRTQPQFWTSHPRGRTRPSHFSRAAAAAFGAGVPALGEPVLRGRSRDRRPHRRSEEHTSELQSHLNLVCRLLLEKKKNYKY